LFFSGQDDRLLMAAGFKTSRREKSQILECLRMNRTRSDLFDPTQLFGDFITLTSQAHSASLEMMINNWEGGLDFFANLVKQADEMRTRSNALLASMAE
jgi:hypothetical protein